MSAEHLSLEPHNTLAFVNGRWRKGDGKSWFYHDPSGIQIYGDGQPFPLLIPVVSIRAYLKRLDKK